MNSVVIVSDGQQRDSAKHTHVSILPQTLLSFRLPYNLEQTSLENELMISGGKDGEEG